MPGTAWARPEPGTQSAAFTWMVGTLVLDPLLLPPGVYISHSWNWEGEPGLKASTQIWGAHGLGSMLTVVSKIYLSCSSFHWFDNLIFFFPLILDFCTNFWSALVFPSSVHSDKSFCCLPAAWSLPCIMRTNSHVRCISGVVPSQSHLLGISYLIYICYFKISSTYILKVQETGEVNFNDAFYLTQRKWDADVTCNQYSYWGVLHPLFFLNNSSKCDVYFPLVVDLS